MPGAAQSSQTTNSSQNQFGTTSLTQNQNRDTVTGQTSSTGPWAAAMPTVTGILQQLNPLIANSGINSAQQTGIDALTRNAQAGNSFAPSIGAFANDLLAGGGAMDQAGAVGSNLADFRTRLSPVANGSMIGNNPALKAQLDAAATDVRNSVNGSFAAAGRDMSGANQEALARGITAAQAPIIAQQYNADTARADAAANALYGAGNTSSGILAALRDKLNSNKAAGVTAADSALAANDWGANQFLKAGGLAQSIPAQTLGLLAQIGIPIAGLGQTSSGAQTQSTTGTNTSQGTSSQTGTGTSTTTNNPSILQQMQGWANLGGSLMGWL
jgi:hypothetical protein